MPGPTIMIGQMGLKGSLRVDRRTKMGTRGGSSPTRQQEGGTETHSDTCSHGDACGDISTSSHNNEHARMPTKQEEDPK